MSFKLALVYQTSTPGTNQDNGNKHEVMTSIVKLQLPRLWNNVCTWIHVSAWHFTFNFLII